MDLAVWRDMSLLWLIFWTLIALLPVGVLLGLAIWGMHRLRQGTRKYLRLAQSGAQRVNYTSDRISRQVTAPVIRLRATVAQVDRLRTATFRRKQA